MVKQILYRLVVASVITAVDVDSLPRFQLPGGSPTPQTLAIEELLRDERVYAARLECRLPEVRGEIARLHRIVLAGDMEAADDLLLESRELVDTQRQFLLRLEAYGEGLDGVEGC